MIVVKKKNDLKKLKGYPGELLGEIESTLTILDDNYGVDRDIEKDLGGYCVVIESSIDIEVLKSTTIQGLELEYVDIIECSSNKYIQILYLLSSDYSIIVYASEMLRKYFE